MSIHSEIKRLRKLKGWSHQQLADKLSAAEGLKKPLAWQTVQQWEREPDLTKPAKSTAPKRARLELVAQILGTDPESLLAGRPPGQPQPQTVDALTPQEAMLVAFARVLTTSDLHALVVSAQQAAARYTQEPEKQRNTGT